MKIDLRKSSKLEPSLNKIYNEISKSKVYLFNQLLEKTIKQIDKKKIDFFVSNTFDRSPLNSSLFKNFIDLFFLDALLKKNYKIDIVITDSQAFYNLLLKHFDKKFNQINLINKKKNFLKLLYSNLSVLILLIIRVFIKVFFIKKKKIIKDKQLIFIDTFILPTHIDEDRYYTGLIDILNQEKIINNIQIYFIPTITNIHISNFFNYYKKVLISDRNFFIKDSYLKISDYFYAIFHYARIKKIRFNEVKLNEIDYSDLINEDLNDIKYNTSIESLLNYRFIKNLYKNKINIIKFINWWENQPIDKGYNLALKKYYKNTNVLGYIGFVPRNFDFQLFPTDYEIKLNMIPDSIGVIGKGYKEIVNKFSTNLNIIDLPALRFDHIFKHKFKINKTKNKNILIALPVDIFKSISLLDNIPKNLDKIFPQFQINIIVKSHPQTPENLTLKNFNINNYKNCIIGQKSTLSYLKECDVLISSMSSICMEALAIGKPCLVFDESIGVEYNPIPNDVDEILWKLCKDNIQILENLSFFLDINTKNNDLIENQSKFIKEKYFIENNKINTINFIN